VSPQTSGYLTWLADVARSSGLPVVETAGWKARGHAEYIECRGVVAHHTGSSGTGNYPSLNTIISGRPDLSGPLAAYGLGRDGTVYVIAAGVCWHAGDGIEWGGWLPANEGNWYSLGIEAESIGTRDDWTPAQRDAYPRLVAAILHYLGQPASRLAGHKEFSTAGKIDPAYWDMNQFRAQVAALLESRTTDMDTTTPIVFPASAEAFFEDFVAAGLGEVIAENFPLGDSKGAPFGTVVAYMAMRACAAATEATAAAHAAASSAGDTAALRQAITELTAVVGAIAAHVGVTVPPPAAPATG